MQQNDEDIWPTGPWQDLWLFDKLILARRLGYECGPAGVRVPKPDWYIVRPVTNLLGMGRGAEVLWIEASTDHLPPGYFWSERFVGRHISVDYHYGSQVLAVEGFRREGDPLWKFSRWERVEDIYELPLEELRGYEYSNVEFIGSRVIEVHLRGNPDFQYDNSWAIPVWASEELDESRRFIVAADYKRIGFYVNDK